MKLIIALDNVYYSKALELMISLEPYVDGFKINHTLLEHTNIFKNYKGELFVDLKLFDTPNTICSVLENILEKGATMTTISTFNNPEVFKCLHQYSEDIKLLGVTYLTSWTENEQFEITREVKRNMWQRHIDRITKAGFRGLICSAQDINDITEINPRLLRVCPGITFKSSNSGQVRTASPRMAQESGADYAVIGRSVTKAYHPVETIKAIKKTMEFRLLIEKLN